MPNSRIAIAPREIPTPSPIFAPVERLLTAAAEADLDGEATLVFEGIVDAREDCEILVGACDMEETVAVVAAPRIDRSELCHQIGIPSPCIASAEERVVISTLNSRLVYGMTSP
jgi:hypothetical protein